MKITLKDSEIIDKIKIGDETALDYLYKKNYKMMTNLVVKNNGSEDEAKDVFQDALVVFWQKTINGDLIMTSRISTYLYSVCQNLWRKELERKSKHLYEVVDKGEVVDYEKDERLKIIHNCLNKIGESCKNILSYYYFDELSMHDIAIKMGFANADTAKTKKYKCKQELDRLIKLNYKAGDFLD